MFTSPRNARQQGLTLVELIVVVAIIGIIAALAVAGFLHAQSRAKTSAVASNMRVLAQALESYAVDENTYPIGRKGTIGVNRAPYDEARQNLNDLTTPVAYLTRVPFEDPFLTDSEEPPPSLAYRSFDGLWGRSAGIAPRLKYAFGGGVRAWALTSSGPDRRPNGGESFPITARIEGLAAAYDWGIYDPTNGIPSPGDICRWGGDLTVPGF